MNIVYMHAYDAGRYVQPYGFPVQTPYLMEFAQQGVLFRQAFAASPTCESSRSTQMGGQYPHELSMYGLPGGKQGWAFADYSKHLVRALSDEGFETVLAGIQHERGVSERQIREDLGYQRLLNEDRLKKGEYDPESINHVESYLAERKNKPFFLSIGIDEPHLNNLGREELGIGTEGERFSKTCYKGIRLMDAYIGRVLHALKHYGYEDNTLVIITSNHGIEFPGGKQTLIDQGIGVMLMIRGPHGFQGGQVLDGLVSQLDIYPTLCELLGWESKPWLRGTSLMPLIRAEETRIHTETYAEQTKRIDDRPEVDAAAMQHAAIGHASASEDMDEEFIPNHHPDTKWFDTAALGLFVHWGISAVSGEVDLSWGMMAGKPWETAIGADRTMTPEAYFQLAGQFQPTADAIDQWLPIAADAGFRYAVFTTRHHDGFALWPSAAGAFNTKLALGGRDLVAEFVEGCRRSHLKVGLYYSPPDWFYNRDYMSFHYGSAAGSGARSFAERAHYGLWHEPIELAQKPDGWHKEFLSYVREQIIELLTRYGKIDLLWFDGGREVGEAISIEEIRTLQPGILVNTRMHGVGDFATPECHLPQERPQDRWEHCNIWAEGPWWANIRSNEQYRPTSWMLSILSQVRGWGGNFLVNIGPRADGSLPEHVPARFAEMQGWLRHSGNAIYEVTAGPYPELSNVPVTCGSSTWYFHLLPGAEGRILLDRPPSTPVRATLLRTGSSLEIVFENDRLTIAVPETLRTPLVDVVAVEWNVD